MRREHASDGWAGVSGGATGGVAATALLALLLVAVPPLRAGFDLFAGTHGARLLVMGLELAFTALVLLDGRVRWPGWPRPRSAAGGALAVWAVASTLAVLASDHLAAGLVRQVEWWGHGLFGVAVWALLRTRPRLLRLVGAGVGVGACVWVAMLLAGPGLATKSLPGFGNLRHFGYFAAVCAGFAAAAGVRRRLDWRGAAAFAALAFAWAFLFWSGTRAGVLATAAALAAAVLLRLGGCSWREGLAWTAAVGLGLAVASQMPTASLHMGAANMARRTAIEAERGAERIGSRRLLLWREGAAELGQSPVLGLGPDAYGFLPRASRSSVSQPHGFPLQFALDWGIPGAIAFALLLGAVGLEAVRRNCARPPPGRIQCGAAIAFLALAAYATATGAWYHAFPSMWTALALALAMQPGNGDEPAPRGLRRPWAFASAGVALIFVLHLCVIVQLAKVQAPAPDSLAARGVRAFPTRVEPVAGGLGVAGWIRAWHREQLGTTLDWMHWLHDHQHRPAPVYRVESRLRLRRGDADGARRHLELALEHERDDETRRAISAELDALARTGRARARD